MKKKSKKKIKKKLYNLIKKKISKLRKKKRRSRIKKKVRKLIKSKRIKSKKKKKIFQKLKIRKTVKIPKVIIPKFQKQKNYLRKLSFQKVINFMLNPFFKAYDNYAIIGCNDPFSCNYNPDARCTKELIESYNTPLYEVHEQYQAAEYCQRHIVSDHEDHFLVGVISIDGTWLWPNDHPDNTKGDWL